MNDSTDEPTQSIIKRKEKCVLENGRLRMI